MPKTGKPMVDIILDRAGQKGTGKWSVIEAQQLGVPATAIEAAVAARVLSSIKDERVAAEKAYGKLAGSAARRRRRCADLELALFAGKIAAYAQGFAVMARPSRSSAGTCRCRPSPRSGAPAASSARSCWTRWRRPSPRAAATNLLMAPAFIDMMQDAHPSLRRSWPRRRSASRCSASRPLAYFDSYRQGAAPPT